MPRRYSRLRLSASAAPPPNTRAASSARAVVPRSFPAAATRSRSISARWINRTSWYPPMSSGSSGGKPGCRRFRSSVAMPVTARPPGGVRTDRGPALLAQTPADVAALSRGVQQHVACLCRLAVIDQMDTQAGRVFQTTGPGGRRKLLRIALEAEPGVEGFGHRQIGYPDTDVIKTQVGEVHGGYSSTAARRPALVCWKGTNPGSCSMQLSQRRTCG